MYMMLYGENKHYSWNDFQKWFYVSHGHSLLWMFMQ